MNYQGKTCSYNEIVCMKDNAESETFIRHLEILLMIVDDAIKDKGLIREDFIFGNIGGQTFAVVEVRQH